MAKAARRNAPVEKVWTEKELEPFLHVPPPEENPVVGTLWEVMGIEPPDVEK